MTVAAPAPPRPRATPFVFEPPRESLIRSLPLVVVVLALINLVTFAVVDFSSIQPGQFPSSWGTSGAVMTLTAAGSALFPGQWAKQGLLHSALLGGLALAAATLSSAPLVSASVIALASWGVGVLAAVLYAQAMRGRSWSPTEALHSVYLLFSVIAVVVPVVLLGVLPNSGFSHGTELNLWWMIRITTYTYIGALLGFVLGWFPEHWRRVSRAQIMTMALCLALSALCAGLFYVSGELQLSWILLIPAVAAGMSLSPQATAAFAIASMMLAGLLPFWIGNQALWYHVQVAEAATSPMPVTILADLMFVSSAFVSIVLSIYRHQGRGLTASLARERVHAASEAALLDQIFESMTDGVVVLGADLVPILQNQASVRLLGRLPHRDLRPTLAAKGWLDSDDRPLETLGVRRALRGETVTTVVKMPQPDGAPLFYRVQASPIAGAESQQIVVIFADVTDERLKHEELRSFAGVVAHDLRAPLTKVDGWLELLEEALDQQEPDAVMNALRQVLAGSRRMGAMIQDWLSVTVHREGELRPVMVELDALISEVTAHLVTSEGSRPRIVVATPDRVTVDPVLVGQVFANLCGNALKYQREGVVPELRITSQTLADTPHVQVSLRDNGIGIPPGEEGRIFEQGHRANAHANTYAGTGRGLALCARVVQRHGGRIWVRNNSDGPGATFFLTLPTDLLDEPGEAVRTS